MNNVVIMAGGVGARFWPLSTPHYPKQFVDILGCGKSLIQLTVERFKGICPDDNIWVVTNQAYVDIVKEHIPTIQDSHILAEPMARNTAPCIAWACWCIRQEDPNANIVVTPSDAVVMNPVEFQRVINNALNFTAHGNSIVTIGIKPNRPETGYGYVQSSEIIVDDIRKVQAFKEKPDLDTAMSYLADEKFLWNAGIFVWNVRTIVDAMCKYNPAIANHMDAIIESGDVQTIFPQCEKISIDYAVMEPAAADGLVYTHPADFGWSDLGNWHSLYEKLEKDSSNNASVGDVDFYECQNCIAHISDAKKVICQGLDNYIISEKDGQILICSRSAEQQIKDFSSHIL